MSPIFHLPIGLWPTQMMNKDIVSTPHWASLHESLDPDQCGPDCVCAMCTWSRPLCTVCYLWKHTNTAWLLLYCNAQCFERALFGVFTFCNKHTHVIYSMKLTLVLIDLDLCSPVESPLYPYHTLRHRVHLHLWGGPIPNFWGDWESHGGSAFNNLKVR